MLQEKNGDKFSGEETIAEFEQLTRDAAAVQREVLRRILSENAAAEYLRELGLAGRTDPESFRDCVPLVTHEDLEPYIARIVDGDTAPVLNVKPVESISLRYVVSDAVQLSSITAYLTAPAAHDAAPARRRGSASTCRSTMTSS